MSTEARAFLAALPSTGRKRIGGDVEWEDRIDRALAEARKAWPGVQIAPATFARYWADRTTLEDGIESGRVADLFLACACLNGDQAGLRHFVDTVVSSAMAAVRRVDATDRFVDEVRAALLQRLLVSEPDRPAALGTYAGRGDLRAWVRVSAVRSAMKLRSRERHGLELRTLDAIVGWEDPEAQHLRSRFKDAFGEAFRAAFGALGSEQKTLLLQHYVDQLTTDQLGGLHRVHRVTISRRLVRARKALLEGTRDRMIRRLDLSPSECDSVIRVVKSQLDITLETILHA